MHTFEDHSGRTWEVEITVSTLKRIRDLAKVDIGKVVEEPAQSKRLDDMATMGSVLFAIAKPQADARQVTEDVFLDALDGPTMARAAAAFWPELDAFFRPCLPLAGGLIALALEVRSKALAKVDGPAPGSGSDSTGSPAKSESTPTP
jgi:hypothetical protein